MEENTLRSGGAYSEWCCIILMLLLLVFQYYTYGTIDPIFIIFSIFMFFLIFMSIYSRRSQRNKVYSHLLHFSDRRVPIQTIMTALQLSFFDVMSILEDLQKKKKLPIEIIEKTGEVAVGELDEKAKKTPQLKQKMISKPITKEDAISKATEKEVKKRYRCTNCGREMEEVYKYCPSCGRPLKKNK